ncbi:MAG: T9SS type A sorting domain-containing protein, partial [Chitinophagales bacterium]|nr:T9SS type A sorting domain-containing protein [Chitinophagales bacterium]
ELGQVVDAFLHEENFSTEVLIDMTGRPSGMYFAKVMMNGEVHTLRFMKQ